MDIQQIGLLSIEDLNAAVGGMDPNYHFCWSTDAGGGAGLYPNYVGCSGPGPTNAEVYHAFFDGFHAGGGRP